MRILRPTLLLLLAGAACTPAPATGPAPRAGDGRVAIATSLDSIFSDTLLAHAHWGVLVRSLATGETLYARNPERMFVPASNLKLVTAAAALEALGPDYRYRTRVASGGPVSDGVLQGDLWVIGSGDPSISARFFDDPRAVFRAWADSLRAHGVRRIAGGVVGVDDVFDNQALGRGWAWDDADAAYSAEVSGLQLNEGVIGIEVRPGATPGSPAVITLDPPTAYVPVASAAVTGERGAAGITATRAAQGPGLVLTGAVRGDTVEAEEIAVRNNTAYFATVLLETLEAAGIDVGEDAWDADDTDRPRPATEHTLFVHASPPLAEILVGFMKPSQNQIGEGLLKTLGAELRGEGSANRGVAVVDSLSGLWGLPRRQLAMADGSGLSRYNLVSPAYLIALLERESRSPHAAIYTAALPVAGRDGTLANRMRGTPLEGNVRAKTGTLSGVRSLSGYLTTAAGEPLVFSMLVNHHVLTARDADRLAEAALLRLYALPPRR